MFTENLSLPRQDSASTTCPPDSSNVLDNAIKLAASQLLKLQTLDGYWVFELETDCTISAEYIVMMHFMDEIDTVLQAKIAHYLRKQQSRDGSYPLYAGGPGDLSCPVKAYYALKMAGDAINTEHLVKARQWILASGGAAKTNVFTRIMLAMFEQLPWRATPFMPVEIMLLPKWFLFHIEKVSYWSRTVMVPLLILSTYRVKARNPGNFNVNELFVTPPNQEKNFFSHVVTPLGKAILYIDRVGRLLEPLIPSFVRRKATAKASDWFMTRLNGDNGLGAIFTAMVNAYETMDFLGIPADNPQRLTARAAIEKLLIIKHDSAYCQPCVSPVWDTGLVALTLQEINRHTTEPTTQIAINSALYWLACKQLLDDPGDWRLKRPKLAGGGWAFQFGNNYYPDLDDTAVVAQALLQSGVPKFAGNIERAGSWIAGMQSKNGGYGAFDVDNTHYYLNQIPFADHGALLDPPTADVSGRCLMFLGNRVSQHPEFRPVIERCIRYLRKEQEKNGSWFGRWGTNYIYGTWSVLVGFASSGVGNDDPAICKAISWLKSKQLEDGGWGESNDSYQNPNLSTGSETSTAFHTALALLAMLAVGEAACIEVKRGVSYLLQNQRADGFWKNDYFNAPGFPKFFYLKYHGYHKLFPLWALAVYRNQHFANGVENSHYLA